MEIILSPHALSDILYWKSQGQWSILKRIEHLISSIEKDPCRGIGKPEKLKHQLAGFWSRRINVKHRLVYELRPNAIYILSLRGHYLL